MGKVFNVSFLHAKGKNQIRDGLMYRKKKLNKNQGMLFHTGLMVSSFWMKNTFIPLDVLFLNKSGKILGYKENNKPHSLKCISIGKKSFYVLEMNGGWVRENKVKVGDKIKIRKTRTRKKRGGKRRKKTRKKRGGNGVCAICQGRLPGVLTRNNSSTITLSCRHRFHRYCLIPWIDTCARNNNPPCCPLCRGTISNNDLPEGSARPQAPEGNDTFVTDDGFDMNRLRVIRTSINYEIGRGVLSELIINSTDAERSLYFLLIRTVVGLGIGVQLRTGDGAFTAQNVLGIYYNIRTQYNGSNGVPTAVTPFFQAMGHDIHLLEGWIEEHNQQ
jgi:uncharacterized membrane protein (UPF0127 family)